MQEGRQKRAKVLRAQRPAIARLRPMRAAWEILVTVQWKIIKMRTMRTALVKVQRKIIKIEKNETAWE